MWMGFGVNVLRGQGHPDADIKTSAYKTINENIKVRIQKLNIFNIIYGERRNLSIFLFLLLLNVGDVKICLEHFIMFYFLIKNKKTVLYLWDFSLLVTHWLSFWSSRTRIDGVRDPRRRENSWRFAIAVSTLTSFFCCCLGYVVWVLTWDTPYQAADLFAAQSWLWHNNATQYIRFPPSASERGESEFTIIATRKQPNVSALTPSRTVYKYLDWLAFFCAER